MAINKETIISVFDEKLILMQWLKTINKALDEAVLTGVTINKKGNATLSFVFTFEDGTTLETDDLILQQGESINGATIRNGHLYLSLTNGDELDAGNLKPVTSFAINASQHLIVYYGDGTSQDLGTLADFSNADFVAKTLKQTNANYSISFNFSSDATLEIDNVYNRFEVINNVLYIVVSTKLRNKGSSSGSYGTLAYSSVSIDSNVANKIYDLEGNTASSANPTQNCVICQVPAIAKKGVDGGTKSDVSNIYLTMDNRQQANTIRVALYSLVNITLAPNETLYLMGRMALTLI